MHGLVSLMSLPSSTAKTSNNIPGLCLRIPKQDAKMSYFSQNLRRIAVFYRSLCGFRRTLRRSAKNSETTISTIHHSTFIGYTSIIFYRVQHLFQIIFEKFQNIRHFELEILSGLGRGWEKGAVAQSRRFETGTHFIKPIFSFFFFSIMCFLNS